MLREGWTKPGSEWFAARIQVLSRRNLLNCLLYKTSKETREKILKQILRQEATGEAGKTTYASLCGPKKAFEAESASAAAAAMADRRFARWVRPMSEAAIRRSFAHPHVSALYRLVGLVLDLGACRCFVHMFFVFCC